MTNNATTNVTNNTTINVTNNATNATLANDTEIGWIYTTPNKGNLCVDQVKVFRDRLCENEITIGLEDQFPIFKVPSSMDYGGCVDGLYYLNTCNSDTLEFAISN